jgi:hypothetical protein
VRDVVLHYHLFKNAGVSIDRILRRRLGADCWASLEGDSAWSRVHPDAVARLIRERPELRAVSSHQARFPPPGVDGVRVHPLCMLREPIDRIGSVYAFERKQSGYDYPSAVAARKSGFAGYVTWALDQGIRGVLCNFQTVFLGWQLGEDNNCAAALGRAEAVVEATVCVGIVERYAESIARFAVVLPEAFHPADGFVPAPANVTGDRLPSRAERVAAIRAELGEPLYARLLDANALDLELYAWALARFDAQPAVAPVRRAITPSA